MQRVSIGLQIGVVVAAVASGAIIFGTFEAPRTESVQHGFRGTGMDLIYNKVAVAAASADNVLPEVIPPAEASGTKSSTVYKNLQVLGDVDVSEFGRLMASLSAWVAPQQGCAYCHGNEGNFASDALYTKRVARRMLQMTRHINADWGKHVGKVGVTCYTCHRGQPVPRYIWFNNPGPASEMAIASSAAGDSSLPSDPFSAYFGKTSEIRVASTAALPTGNRQSIKQTEGTYALMIHMANALGVNCTFCHNTRAFYNWDQSTPQRVNAWYGIRMVRDIDANYLESLKGVFPAYRLGPHGDVPKVNCTTCHQGAYKPLLGASMVSTYPELAQTTDVKSVPQPAEQQETPPAAAPAPAAPPPAAAPAPAAPPPAAPAAPPPAPAAAPAPDAPPPAAPAPPPPAPSAPPQAEASPPPQAAAAPQAQSAASDNAPEPYSAPTPDEAGANR